MPCFFFKKLFYCCSNTVVCSPPTLPPTPAKSTALFLMEIFSAFYSWVWCYLWACHIWPLLCWGVFLTYTIYWGFLSWKDIVFFQMLLLHLFTWSYDFSFILLMCQITFIDLCMLNHTCTSEINHIWIMVSDPLNELTTLVAGILLNIFTCVFIRNIDL